MDWTVAPGCSSWRWARPDPDRRVRVVRVETRSDRCLNRLKGKAMELVITLRGGRTDGAGRRPVEWPRLGQSIGGATGLSRPSTARPEHSVALREPQLLQTRSVHHLELMSQRQDLKLQSSPIAERCTQGQEQRDDDGSHRWRRQPRKLARSIVARRTELLAGIPTAACAFLHRNALCRLIAT